ncbi:shikimate dehydrogenase family protein [Pseudofulvibacter geojedonensis]|uniref:Shikimate dehydrogenase family protein n=1 Tax=Pseudofulvibacter geojedonensis TaxID=1123758 RepID=A0ABW3HZL9_9FLAO
MEAKQPKTKLFGLIGKNISYSFSQRYFSEKFKTEKLENYQYQNFDIQSISKFNDILIQNPNLKGLNVTIPYKETILPLLDKISSKAQRIGAVNTIRITKKGNLKGYNTDEYGFRKSLTPLLTKDHKKALILGTGGASKAIAYSLKKLNIPYQFVSRKDGSDFIYDSLTSEIISEHQIIINCTPLGTSPNINDCPDIPYEAITNKHLLYDLIYNPSETLFLKKGREQGAITSNGLNMLELQAEKAWKIWNK